MTKIIGLTGGSGAGKSTVAKVFALHGARVIDGDIVARSVVEKGKPALVEIIDTFGKQVLLPEGSLNRAKLAKIVFSSQDALHKLNEITHKYITEEICAELKSAKEPVVVIDAAALFESGINRLCDAVVCVTAEKEMRIKRIIARDNLTHQSAKERIEAQKDDSFYIKNSDFCIENNGDEQELFARAAQIINGVKGE